MADAAVTFLLENVMKLLVEQTNLILGAEKELKQLQSELELMKAFLIDCEETKDKREVFIQYEKQIREAIYDAEDTLDACLTDKAKAEGSRKPTLKAYNLAKKVKELMHELFPIFEKARNGLNALPTIDGLANRPGRSDDRLENTQTLREDNVVGFKDEEETLVKYLYAKKNELDVISIVGMPGLGKTTLAWKIYRDQKIQFEFPTLIWVYVSQELNVKKVFRTILKKFTQEDMSNKTYEELIQLVRSHLKKGKFLLFMDDVWTTEDWKRIEAALPKENCSGKVLITSRHEGVANQTNPKRSPHKLRFLNFEESWCNSPPSLMTASRGCYGKTGLRNRNLKIIALLGN